MTEAANETPSGQKRRIRYRLIWIGLSGLLILGGVAMTVLPRRAGTLLYEPGGLTGTEGSIRVLDAGPLIDDAQGAGAESMFVTVSRRESTLFDQWIRRRFDPSLEFVPREEVYGHATKTEVDKINSQQMVDSKRTAEVVALEALNVQVDVSGSGALVLEVFADTPAAEFLHAGDVITKIDGKVITTVDQLRAAMAPHKVGDSVSVEARSKGVSSEHKATLVADPDDAEHAILGIHTETADLKFDIPIKLEMNSGNVSGPSAGLAWTLAVIDHLSAGDLGRGVRFAATGEIAMDGSVLPIGSLPQKAVAVKRAGVRHFLIPKGTSAADLSAAKKLVGSSIVFHPVSDIREAMSVVGSLRGTDSSADEQRTPG